MMDCRQYVLTREVTKKECDWLDRTFVTGETVYEYNGCTYGCISHSGNAFTLEKDETPFFELPKDSVKMLPSIQFTTLTDKHVGSKVTYVPRHAFGNASHPDAEGGRLKSWNELGAFVDYGHNTCHTKFEDLVWG